MDTTLPPVKNMASLQREVSMVPERHRNDAVQEAWLAHLSGESATAAVQRFVKRERRNESRFVPLSEALPDDDD
jgi:hypothetical protein